MTGKSYPSDLTDAAWKVLQAALSDLLPRYRDRRHPLRRICDALAYRLRTGCQRRYRRRAYPPPRLPPSRHRVLLLQDPDATWDLRRG